ncbi:glycosyltransferase family 32 protein [Daldinia caldariorum]|uniref:glycosyltransferase family 32 protein n=1 Tax=Daldinia caldariorum TaxID=326644 RepID=UPI00200797F0|nr:glycosyltransferase family 32 protein [Daldinia caldariorum]KAI1468962.1 glycosyltransferase family 32 protein [Daldinia caldariorum]
MSRKYFLVIAATIVSCLLLVFFSSNSSINPTRLTVNSIGNVNLPVKSESSLPQEFPKKIWQSWKDDSDDPTDRTMGFPRQWRASNPHHRYERITDANGQTFVAERLPSDIANLFSTFSDPILRADFLRYCVMLVEGGVWADIDVRPHRPISEWIPPQYLDKANLVVGIENDHHKRPIWRGSPYSVQLAQYTILAKPHHPAIAKLVERVKENLKTLLQSKKPGEAITFEDVMATTGPFAFTEVLMDYFTNTTGLKHTGDELDGLREPKLIGDVLVLPKDAFGWLPQEHYLDAGDPGILVEHLFIASWRGSHPG